MSDASRAKMQAVLEYINEYNAEYGYAHRIYIGKLVYWLHILM